MWHIQQIQLPRNVNWGYLQARLVLLDFCRALQVSCNSIFPGNRFLNVPFVLDHLLLPILKPHKAITVHLHHITGTKPSINKCLLSSFRVISISSFPIVFSFNILGRRKAEAHRNTVGPLIKASPGCPGWTSWSCSLTIRSLLVLLDSWHTLGVWMNGSFLLARKYSAHTTRFFNRSWASQSSYCSFTHTIRLYVSITK